MDLSTIPDSDILEAYRLGIPIPGKHRPIIIRCVTGLKQYILDNAIKLNGRFNEEGSNYYINPQLPDSLAEQRRENRQNIKERKEKEKPIPKENKSTFNIKNGKLYINGQVKRKLLSPPSVLQLFPDEDQQKKIDNMRSKILRSKPESGSMFRITVFRPSTIDEARLAYIKLFQEFPSADHIAGTFCIGNSKDYQDNGEFGSGFRLLKVLNDAGLDNIAIFMIRHHGGTNLGPRRFVIMTDLARAALDRFCTRGNPGTVPVQPSENDDKENVNDNADENYEDQHREEKDDDNSEE